MGILAVLGTPSEDNCPGLKRTFEECIETEFPAHAGNDLTAMMNGGDPRLIDLVLRMLKFDPMRMISAKEALSHTYSNDIPKKVRRQCVQGLAAE
jgi:hypothetical protein